MASKCKSGDKALTENQTKILKALAAMNEPGACKDVASGSGLESKSVSCQLRSLKDKGLVESPARCRYAITENGRAALA